MFSCSKSYFKSRRTYAGNWWRNLQYNTDSKKFAAVHAVKDLSNYKADPVRRVYISWPDGKKGPLGIPSIKDRVVQTLYLFALDPIVEELADTRSYGFRMYMKYTTVSRI